MYLHITELRAREMDEKEGGLKIRESRATQYSK
jgi:hypothetical protein